MSRFKTLSSKITTREKSHSGHRKQAQCEKPFVTSLEDRLKQTRANRHRTETENIYIPNLTKTQIITVKMILILFSI